MIDEKSKPFTRRCAATLLIEQRIRALRHFVRREEAENQADNEKPPDQALPLPHQPGA